MYSDNNHLHFHGDVGENPLPTLAALHDIIHKQGYSDVTLDFRRATRVWVGHMLPVVTTCRAYRIEKVDFDIILPDDKKLSNIMINTNWTNLIDPEHYVPNQGKNIRNLPATQFKTPDEQYSAVDKSIEILLGSLPGIDKNRIKALEWAINEITGNVLDHAGSDVGGILQVSSFPAKNRVEFYVCDHGMTIPKSLRSGRPDISDDPTALHRAIEEGVTKDKSTNQGNGLFGTYQCCAVSSGEFDIISGNAMLRHKPGQLNVSRNPIPFNGTYVRASIGYKYDKLLETALVFKGKAHDPGFDYIERKYEDDKQWINLIVAEQISDFGSRPAGRFAFNKIENLMDNRSTPVILDFKGVRLISSSFADEVFGKLFVKLGPIAFNQLCHFRNVDQTVRLLIDRAISQRIANP